MNTIKQRLAALVLFAVLFGACAQSKEIRETNKDINGEWTVQTVSVEGAGGSAIVKVFDEATFKCFIGSVWKFNNKKNGTGFYGLQNNGDCPAVKRNIHWAVHETSKTIKTITFIKLDTEMKPVDINNTYTLEIGMISATNMQLKWNTTYENKPAAIVFNFTKNR